MSEPVPPEQAHRRAIFDPDEGQGAVSHPWWRHHVRVLYLEDEDLPAEVVLYILQREEPQAFQIQRTTSLAATVAALNQNAYDVVLIDLNLPDSEGWETFAAVHRAAPETAVVILTGDPDTEIAVRAVGEGAQDYLYKHELNVPGLLTRVLHYAVTRHHIDQALRAANRSLEQRNQELQRTMASLEQTRLALVESEKIKSMGQMAAGIAHEIKNPLAIIRMGLDYLSGAQPEKAPQAIARTLPEMVSALDRANTILSEMLDYAAPRALQVEAFPLNEVVREALVIMGTSLCTSGIEVLADLDEELPEIELDRQKMIQVMINLIGNASQAMPNGGLLRIRTRRTQFPVDSSDATSEGMPEIALLEVQDSGTGIREEDLEHVFDPFFTTRAGSGGTGLGLSVCKMILDLHGGRLTLQNHPDGGSVATIQFIL
ncbi:MAG: response regulator [Verrucomicrobia bacterium]|nr:response regulator [Verrucomicrobiota bacterium]